MGSSGAPNWGGGSNGCQNFPTSGIFQLCPTIFAPRPLPWASPEFIGLGFLSFISIILTELFGSPFLKNISIIVGLAVGCIVAGAAGYIDGSTIKSTPVITFLWSVCLFLRTVDLFLFCSARFVAHSRSRYTRLLSCRVRVSFAHTLDALYLTHISLSALRAAVLAVYSTAHARPLVVKWGETLTPLHMYAQSPWLWKRRATSRPRSRACRWTASSKLTRASKEAFWFVTVPSPPFLVLLCNAAR